MTDPDHDPWLAAWQTGCTPFHRAAVHPHLRRFDAEFLAGGPHRVLVPLCGKSLDLKWMADQGHDVVGLELSELAVRALFDEAGVRPAVEHRAVDGAIFRYSRLSVVQGDIFAVTPAEVGALWTAAEADWRPVRVWDRAALIALPPSIRGRYVQHLRALAGPGAVVLQQTILYDESVMDGAPWSVREAEIRVHYAGARIEVLLDEAVEVVPRFAARGHQWMREAVLRIELP